MGISNVSIVRIDVTVFDISNMPLVVCQALPCGQDILGSLLGFQVGQSNRTQFNHRAKTLPIVLSLQPPHTDIVPFFKRATPNSARGYSVSGTAAGGAQGTLSCQGSSPCIPNIKHVLQYFEPYPDVHLKS